MTKLDEHVVGKGLDKARLSVFRKFIRREELDDIITILKENEIPFQAWEKKEVLIPIIIGEALTPRFWVEIEDFNFSKVNELLKARAKENLQDVNLEQHHLNEMNDAELKEIILKADEWSPESVLIAKMILGKRDVRGEE